MPKKSTTFEQQFADEPKKSASKKPASKPAVTEPTTIINPFTIGTTGLEWVFARAKNVAILLLVLSAASLVYSIADVVREKPQEPMQPINLEALLTLLPFIVVFFLLIAAVTFFLQALVSYTSAQIALGQTVGLKQAARAALKRFWGVAALYLLMGLKVLGWTLLGIIPGIIMSVRYSLAGTVYFAEEGTSPNQALKRSADLTKGSFMTVLSAKSLLNLVTFGLISELVETGANTVLYRQLKDIEANKLPTPQTHWLSWVTTTLFYTLLALLAVGLVLLIILADQRVRL